MRLRHVKGAKEKIKNHPEFIIDHHKGDDLFLDEKIDEKPIHIEIGMGKGQFLFTLAKRNPEIQFIGIEKYDSVIVRALEKVIEEPLDNLLFIRGDANFLLEFFNENSLERIYLTFSDPWPKNRHEKRRLTHHRFLKMYDTLLKPNGEIHFKTDNDTLFNYSVESIKSYPMTLTYLTHDLHRDDTHFNVMTEFEEKFIKLDKNINKFVAKF
ncbi:MAG: tRNA (guanosine(46)-N7)-methyltransferase TrmB [Candidatus Izimaplasma sp.]|nr:tRNA (guanosine(46)-N7)-methyltransferase TrmB [Candidatus Izimaplasma bacterium]